MSVDFDNRAGSLNTIRVVKGRGRRGRIVAHFGQYIRISRSVQMAW